MKTKIILLLILFAGFFLRFYKLGTLPSILNRDEAALAYNALLIKQVGQDEWGKSWPLILESFGDYKLPGYPYFTAFIFNFAPANDLTIKLGSFLAGVILIYLAYQLAQHSELLHRQSLHFAFLIAVSPIFFFYSRIAFESNLALLLFVTSIFLLLFFKAKNSKRLILDVLAVLFLLLSVFTYNSPFILLPFVILALPPIRGIKKWRKWAFPALGLLVVFIISLTVFVPLTSQKSGVTIFSDETTWTNLIQHRQQFSGIQKIIFGNKYVYYSQIIFNNIYKSFSAKFLVTNGGTHPWHSLANLGHIYWSVYLFGVLGIVWSLVEVVNWIRHKFDKTKHKKISKRRAESIKQELILLYLLFVSLIPASITVDAPHATRSLLFFFIFTLFAVIAIEDFYHLKLFKKFDKKHLLTLFFVAITIIESSHYFYKYFAHYPENQPESLKIGFEKTINNLDKNYANQKVAIVDPGGYQYILTAWYLKIAPHEFLNTVIKQNPNQIGFRYGEQIKNYHFIAEPEDRSADENILLEWTGSEWVITEHF